MPVFRLDSDTAAERGAHARILARFGEAPSGVLVGTQMVAKGHDFPEVTLSAILDADATLRFPDFRAEERTFAMVAQLAGRCGRGEAGGEVIVQTLAPGASSIEHAARHDSAGFLAGELERRAAAPLPALLPPGPDRLLLRAGGAAGNRRPTVAAELREALPRGLRAARAGADVPRPQPPPPPHPDQGRRPRGTDRGGARGGRAARRRPLAARRSRSASTSTRSDRRRGAPPKRLDSVADERRSRNRTDDERERELEAELLERREAALAHVVKFGDPVLKSRASPVANFGPELRAEVERMIAIMRDGMGVGLAATQLGVLRRLLVFQAGPDGEPTALVNPVIEWLSEDELALAEEGCLSLPRVSMDVERPLHVRVSGRDAEGEAIEIEASGLEARVLQHEIDHLDGVLILDRTTRAQRKGALRALREGGSYSPPAEHEAGDGDELREPRTDA